MVDLVNWQQEFDEEQLEQILRGGENDKSRQASRTTL